MDGGMEEKRKERKKKIGEEKEEKMKEISRSRQDMKVEFYFF